MQKSIQKKGNALFCFLLIFLTVFLFFIALLSGISYSNSSANAISVGEQVAFSAQASYYTYTIPATGYYLFDLRGAQGETLFGIAGGSGLRVSTMTRVRKIFTLFSEGMERAKRARLRLKGGMGDFEKVCLR